VLLSASLVAKPDVSYGLSQALTSAWPVFLMK
jgi:hypothetical protein